MATITCIKPTGTIGVLGSSLSGIYSSPMPLRTRSTVFAATSKTYNKKYWPHQYKLLWISWNNTLDAEIERWCWLHVKGQYWHSYKSVFVFKRSEDAIMFKLRWHDYCTT